MRAILPILLLAAASSAALPAQVGCFESQFGTSIGVGDDVVLPMQSLGFAFPFGGQTYTDVTITTNGLLYLSNGGVPTPGGTGCCSATTAVLLAGAPKIAPHWIDLNMVAPGSVLFNNTVPGRAVITWDRAVDYTFTQTFTFQCQLLVTGEIAFSYGPSVAIYSANTCLCGISPGNGATDPGSSDLSTVTVGTSDTVYELFNSTSLPFDLAGKTVLFTPNGASGYVTLVQVCSAHELFGNGCLSSTSTFYELFPASSFDLSGRTTTLFPNGTGYTVLNLPISSFFTPVAASLGLTDDSLSASLTLPAPFPYANGVTNSIIVHSNGQVFLDGTAVADYSPTVAEMLSRGTSVGVWNDFNPAAAGSGNVHFDIDPSGSIAYVTWNGVYCFGTTTPWTWQIALFLAGSGTPGQIELRFQSLNNNSTLSQVAIAGFCEGHASADPGGIDLSAAAPFSTSHLVPLQLTAAPLPTLGSTITFTTSNIPATAVVSADIISFTAYVPGIDLTPFGAPGCFQHIGLNGSSQLLFGNPTAVRTVSIPNSPVYSGLVFKSQSLALVPGINALGVVTSNGIKSTIL